MNHRENLSENAISDRWNAAVEESKARFPFKQVKGKKGIKFRQEMKRKGEPGTLLEVEHNGHDHLGFDLYYCLTLPGWR